MIATSSIFRESSHEKQLQEQGYANIPLLSAGTVQQLIDAYRKHAREQESREGFHISLTLDDPNQIRAIQEQIVAIVSPELDQQFENYQVFTSSFTIKEPGEHFIVPPHQDWTFTDETKFASYTCWIPLQAVNLENGTLGVIPGSHRWFDTPRASPSPYYHNTPIIRHSMPLYPYLRLQDLAAGEALLMDNRTIHGSPPNRHTLPRLAVGVGLMAASAPIRHWSVLPGSDNEIAEYEVDKDFLVENHNGKLAAMYETGNKLDYEELQRVQIQGEPLSWEDLKAILDQAIPEGPDPNLLPKQAEQAVAPEPEIEKEEEPVPVAVVEDDRTFFETYTLRNIIAEIRWRISKASGRN